MCNDTAFPEFVYSFRVALQIRDQILIHNCSGIVTFRAGMKKIALGCLALLVPLVLVSLIGGCVSYNKMVGMSQNVDRSWAQVQNQYQRRYDLIPNLVGTVEGAANFEKSTITEVTQARASVGQVRLDPNQAPNDAAQLEKFEQAQGQLSSALSRLLVVSERYPELRATQNFRDLQAELAGTENRIAVERMRFNEAVQKFNTTVQKVPTVILARLFGFQPKPYFESVAGAEAPPKVQFDFKKK
jgi:LemA protein